MLSVIIFLPILAWNVAWFVLQVMQALFDEVRDKAVNNAVVGALGSFMVLILRINVLPPPCSLPPQRRASLCLRLAPFFSAHLSNRGTVSQVILTSILTVD